MSSTNNLTASSNSPADLVPTATGPPVRHTPTDSTANYSPHKERGSFSLSTKSESSLAAKLRACFRGMLLCCTGCDGDEGASETGSGRTTRTGSTKGLVISGPTNFRREDFHIAGLTPEQDRLFRAKAVSDAQKMWTTLQPLRSSPSGTFSERPAPAVTTAQPPMTLPPTYEEFTQPRSPPATPSTTAAGEDHRTSREGGAGLKERVKKQGRRVSGNFASARIFSSGSAGSRGKEITGRTVSGGSRRISAGEGAGLGLGVVGGGGGGGVSGDGAVAGPRSDFVPVGSPSQPPLLPLPPTPPQVGTVGDESTQFREASR